MNLNCPPPDQLKQLTLGNLPNPPASEVEAHLLECPDCQQTTANLNVADTFVDAVRKSANEARAAGNSLDADDQARVARIISDLSGLHRHSGTSATQFTPERTKHAYDKTAPHGADELLAELAQSWLPAQQPDELGRLGDYRVLRLLGAGGMGGVFLAEDLQLKRHVALKVMRPHVTATPGAAERFLREAQAAAAVRHDHVVTIYQVGRDHGVPFIAQELLAGETLDDRLKRESRLPVTEAISMARQIAAGLSAAHARGLIHRDIKPTNIWLEESSVEGPESRAEQTHPTTLLALDSRHPALDSPRVKLLDFGLARPLVDDANLTQSGVVVGTPAYMAPEQASSDPVDHRADLFSLGVVLYRMTTGRLPFAGKNAIEIMIAAKTATPAAPSSLNAEIPAALSDLILRLLAKQPAQRPESAAAVVRELKTLESAVQAGSRIIIRPQVVAAKQPPRKGSRFKLILSGGAALVVLLGVIIITITNKDGTKTRLEVPDTSKIEIATGEPSGAGLATKSKEPSRPLAVPPIETTAPLAPLALVPTPAKIAGLKSWTLETALHRGTIVSVAGGSPNPEHTLLALTSSDGVIRLWDMVNERLQRALVDGSHPVSAMAWSADGQLLAARYPAGKRIVIWEVATGKRVAVIERSSESFYWETGAMLAWSPLRTELVIADLGGLTIWDLETRETKQHISIPCHGVAWKPDGTLLAVGYANGSLQLYDPATWAVKREIGKHPNAVNLAWSPQGDLLATVGHVSAPGGDLEWVVKLWHPLADTAPPELDFGTLRPTLPVLAWSSDGKQLATSCRGGEMHVAVRFDVETGKVLGKHHAMAQAGVYTAAFTPGDANLWVVAINGRITSHPADGGNPKVEADRVVVCGNFSFIHTRPFISPDGNRLVFPLSQHGGGWHVPSALLVETSTAQVLGELRDVLQEADVAWSPLANTVALSAYNGNIWITNSDFVKRNELKPSPGGKVTSVTVSPDGMRVAGACQDVIQLWDIRKDEPVAAWTAHVGGVTRVAWSPDGQWLASGGADKLVKIWNAQTQKLVHELPGHRGAKIDQLQWSHDSTRLLSNSWGENELRVWDPMQGTLVRMGIEIGLYGGVMGWQPAPRRVVTMNTAGAIQTWDEDALEPLCTVHTAQPGTPSVSGGVVFASGGAIGVSHSDQALRLYETQTGRLLSTWLVIAGKGVVKVSPEGHFRGAPEIDQELIVVAETDAGEQVTLSLSELEKKYGWKNDPERAISAPFETTAAPLKPDDHNPGHREPGESPVVAKADDRRAAEWVLSIGGNINIIQNGEGRMIAVAGDLPRGAFQLDAVDLRNNQKVSDAGLVNFQDCKNIMQLNLLGTQVGDAGLANFKECKQFTSLELGSTQVSDAGLAHFKGKNLTHLYLGNTKVSDAGLAHFKDCKNLKVLHLGYTQVSDAGLAHFKDCKNLTSLDLRNTNVSDAGLAHFRDCRNLTSLQLYGPQVSDAGLSHFKDCESLTYLDLNATRVSDAGLSHFSHCPKLAFVHVTNTKVTEAGVKKLSAALPGCKIEWDGGVIEPMAHSPTPTAARPSGY